MTPRKRCVVRTGIGVRWRKREGRGWRGFDRDQGRVKRMTEDFEGEKVKPCEVAHSEQWVRVS